ncbi:MAG TPA: alpha/beta hydrolase [Candidatus Binatia bacterium]|nr:alpha/beta hydrolase [Candidatus Binatia bacterium]
MTEGTTRVGAASVRWRRDGTGPAIVFLHGFPLSGETWDGVIAGLRDRFTCWTLDLIGLGGSSSTADEDYASPGQARAFARVLSELGVGPFALVGNDTGGWMARELALLDPRRVLRLVLTNTEIPGHRPPWIPTYQVLAQLPGTALVFAQLLKLSAFRRSSLGFGGCFHDLGHLDGPFHARFVEPLLHAPGRLDGAMRFLREMKFARLDEFARLHRELTMPTLFVWGADDPTFPEPRARAMLPQFPNVAGFHALPDAKLFFYEEHPVELARLVRAFAC